MRRKLTSGFRYQRKTQAELASKIESTISGIRLTKAFNNQEEEIKRFKLYNDEYQKARKHTFKALGLFSTGNEFFINLTNLVLLVSGCLFLAYDDSFTIIDLTTYFLYINYLVKPISRLVNSIEQIEQGLSGIERFMKIMEVNPKIVNKENAIIKKDFQGDIEFKDVSFNYERSEASHVLNHFDLHIESGKKIALVGETGVGKSTISKLVPRFYDCNEGSILIDGIDVKDYDFFICSVKLSIHDIIFNRTIKNKHILFNQTNSLT